MEICPDEENFPNQNPIYSAQNISEYADFLIRYLDKEEKAIEILQAFKNYCKDAVRIIDQRIDERNNINKNEEEKEDVKIGEENESYTDIRNKSDLNKGLEIIQKKLNDI